MTEASQKVQIEFIDIFPSLNEISDTEPLSLKIGNSELYNLSSLVSLNKELELINPNSQMQIVKNGTVIAKSKFNYSNGTQWITFNYEGKKQNNNSLALSLIDCIKLKVKCNGNAAKMNNSKKVMQPQFSYKKTSIRNKMLGIKSSLPKQQNVKQSHNRSYEEDINFTNYFKDIGEITTTNKRNSKVLASSIILNNNRNLHTPVNKTRNLNFTSISNNTQKNNNNFNTYVTSRKVNQSSSQEKRDKTPTNARKNNITYLKNHSKKLKQCNTSTDHGHTKTTSMKSNESEQKPNKEIVKKLDTNFINSKKKDNRDTSSSPNKIMITEAEKIVQRESQNSNTIASPTLENENNTESNSLLHSTISQELIKLNLPNESNNLLDDNINGYDFDSTDTFGQLKNDFNLLYTEEYIKMIPDDLLRLELELLIEKMFEIVNCYHSQMSNEKKRYSKVNELYKECSQKYLLFCKKYSQLKHQKENYQISKQNLNFIKGNYIKNVQNVLTINKDEMNMFTQFVKPKRDDSTMLKEILGVILMNNKKFIKDNIGEKEVRYLEQHVIQKQKKKNLNDVPPIKGISNVEKETKTKKTNRVKKVKKK